MTTRRNQHQHRRAIAVPTSLLAGHTEERLDAVLATWRDGTGITQDLRKMDQQHLASLFNWLKKRSHEVAAGIVAGEMVRRQAGTYPPPFPYLLQLHTIRPEVDRLKVYTANQPKK